jgi:iron complex outermembrane receptor protein
LSAARRLVRAASIAALALGSLAAHAREPEDLTALPFEQLMQSEVVGAASFARSITDAASAVSVLTRQDIQAHGARTLAEVLDMMRGIHVSYDDRYGYLGARGVGGTRTLAGRVMLFIDGVPAVDNIYDQLYLVHDSLLDVALIERIEYAPGSGSALYGNNAFLGVINVVTQRGRDLDGAQFSALADSWRERSVRASWGRRLADEAEVLVSTTLRRGITMPSADAGRDCFYQDCDGRSEQFFLKGRWHGWRAQLMASQIETRGAFDDLLVRSLDRTTLASIGHDGTPAEQWHSSLGLTLGRYAFRSMSTGDEPAEQMSGRTDGGWWVADGRLVFTGWVDQRIAIALQARQDPVMRFVDEFAAPDGGPPEILRSDDRRRAIAASAEHEMRWSPQWRSTLGLRVDRRTRAPWTWSPRVALMWDPDTSWSVKLSHGRASRFASANEGYFLGDDIRPAETVVTTELVGEFRRDNLRLLSSAYGFDAERTIGSFDNLRDRKSVV